YAAGAWSVLSTVISPYGNFTAPATSGPVNLNSIAIDPAVPGSLWVLSEQGVYHSSDGGVSWSGELTAGTYHSYSNTNGGGFASSPFSGRTITAFGGTVMAGGWSGDVIISYDGGATWSNNISFSINGYPRPQLLDSYSGILLIAESSYSSGWMLATSDGGRTWSGLVDGGTAALTGFHFFDRYTGWVVGVNAQISKIDLHASPMPVLQNGVDNGGWLLSIAMLPDGLEGWSIGFPDRLLHTVDGGISWQVQPHPPSLSLWDLQAVDAGHVWALGRADAYGTPQILRYDGSSWSQTVLPGSMRWVNGIAMADPYTGYVVGDSYSNITGWHRSLLHTSDGMNWTQVGSLPPTYANDMVVDSANPQSLWLVGDGVYHSKDGGVSWSGEMTAGRYLANGQVVAQPFPASSISVRGNTIVVGDWGQGSVYAQNVGSGILSSQDGGSSWHYTQQIGGGRMIPKMVDASVGLALDGGWQGSGWLYRTVDGGISWQHVAAVGSGPHQVEGFDVVDSYSAWVVGQQGRISRVTLPLFAVGSGTLAGTINNMSGQSGANYALLYSSDWTKPLALVAADASGAFSFANLPDGSYNLAAVVDVNGAIDRYGMVDQSVDPIGEFAGNPLTISGGVVQDRYGVIVTSASIAITGLGSRYYFPPGITTITWTAKDANGAVLSTVTQSVVVGVTRQAWDTLHSSGDTASAASQFATTLSNDPTNIEAAVGLCVTNFADLLSNPQLRGLLTSMTSDAGATLPSSATVAMSIANKTALQRVNWLSRMAINGTQVQADAFTPIVPQISGCITQLESALGAGFVSQSISNPAALLGGSTSVQVDVDDVNLLLAQLYALRSQIYWLDAYNWSTDVDGDGVVDTMDASFTDSYGMIYQYQTINVDPYAVFNDPTFFTKRVSGAFKGSGVQDLAAALADAQVAASRGRAVLTNFNSNTTRGLDGGHLFSFGSLSKLSKSLTNAINADSALNGIGYSGNFSQPGSAAAAAGVVHAEIFYTLFDRTMLPQLQYDVPPDPVASKRNNSPIIYDDRAGNIVKSFIYFGSYPDPTVGGSFTGGAALDKREQKIRPTATIVLNVAGVPISNYQYNDPTGSHNVFWPGGVMGDSATSTLHAVRIDQNWTLNSASYTVYSVDLQTGLLTAILSGTLAGTVDQRGSGTFIGGVARLPGWTATQNGFWSLFSGTASLVPVASPPGAVSTGDLRSSGSATGLVHWYWGDFVTTQYLSATSVTSGGTVTLRERYPVGSWSYLATPLGTDTTLKWLIYEPDVKRISSIVPGTTPTAARTYYAPFFQSQWRGHYHLLSGKMVDAGNLPKVSIYPLPTTLPAATTASVTP
ncbi:MAG: hypothetical protein Q9M13_08395, partial [Mariprofundales bacterium]|nr:hypothetical protein [Mariprofundales bacterium]